METDRRYAARRQLWDQALAGESLSGKSVLDAGSGQGFLTRFLAERNPSRLVSISCSAADLEEARQRSGEWANRIEFVAGDLAQAPFSAGEFDIVFADYLIAAVAGHTPFRETDVVRELVRITKPGGRLILTGWEVWPKPRIPLEIPLRRLLTIRESAHILQGEIAYREHPSSWVQQRLLDFGAPAERTVIVPDYHRDVRWLVQSVRKSVDTFPDGPLRMGYSALVDECEEAIRESNRVGDGFDFGQHYAVVALKLAGAVLLG